VIRRVFYLSLGATVGVLVFRRLASIADSMQPDHVARKALGGVEGFAREVRAGMKERERELRSALGLEASGHEVARLDGSDENR
jgi:hypothetical protein